MGRAHSLDECYGRNSDRLLRRGDAISASVLKARLPQLAKL
jgi:hypothetical protein